MKRLLRPLAEWAGFTPYYDWIRGEVARASAVTKLRKDNQLLRYEHNAFRGFKGSDTLFVLGSGASINKLTPENWKEIASHDTLGLNFWLLHSFVPTFYQFELSADEARNHYLLRMLHQKWSLYENVHFIYKDLENGHLRAEMLPEPLRNSVYASQRIALPANNLGRMSTLLKVLSRCGLDKYSNAHLFCRASISQAIYFGRALGYDKIVLLGVDLNNTRYFWENGTQHGGLSTGQGSTVHKTMLAKYGEVTVDRAIYMFNEHLLRPRNINLYIGDKESLLSERLPVYFTPSLSGLANSTDLNCGLSSGCVTGRAT